MFFNRRRLCNEVLRSAQEGQELTIGYTVDT
jgi:hypothetical protein